MKLWRKMGRKEVREDGTVQRTGRLIKQSFQLQEYALRNAKKTTPLLDALFDRAGIKFTLTAKQIEAFNDMIAAAANGEDNGEVNEAK